MIDPVSGRIRTKRISLASLSRSIYRKEVSPSFRCIGVLNGWSHAEFGMGLDLG
jgi:hypothetical protein